MAAIDLTQAEADALLSLEKRRADDIERDYPGLGGSLSIPLVSTDGREDFSLDLYRGRINLSKGRYQTRGHQIAILARLDFGGAPHRNPDGTEIGSPHLHLYREGFGDKWAFPVPHTAFTDLNNYWHTLQEFMIFCHIVEPPMIRKGLFT
jgi:hypothetical protein